MAEAFCKQFKLEFVRTFKDEGISGFRGKNFSHESALSAFLKLVDNGQIEKGSVLILESMDRLSRESSRKCLPKFLEIINRGIAIGVVSLGKILDEKSIDENQMELMFVLMEFSRANNESFVKSERQKSIIRGKIEKIQAGEKVWFGVQKPSWIIGLKDGKFVLDEKRVVVVKSIFERYLSGHSTNKIADSLNELKTPTLRLFKDKTTNNMKLWTNSTVAELLRNKNVRGWFGINGVEFDNYFPAIVSEKDFLLTQNKLQTNVKNRGGSKHGLVRNLFKGLLFCPCENVIETKVGSYTNVKGSLNHYSHYICRGVKNKSGCTNKGRFYVSLFEQDIFAMVLGQSPDELLFKPRTKAESATGKLELQLLKLDADINDTVKLIGKVKLPQLDAQLTTFEKQKAELELKLKTEQAKEVSNNTTPLRVTKLKQLLDATDDVKLNEALGQMVVKLQDTKIRQQLRNIMPDLFTRIELDFVKGKYAATFTNGKQRALAALH